MAPDGAALDRLLEQSTPKPDVAGIPRTCAPSETVERLLPSISRFGITRIANVTGLDRLGIPVVLVIRPNARSVSVSLGAGADLDEARAAGLMEGVETHLAERPQLSVRSATFATIREHGHALHPRRLPLLPDAAWAPDVELVWVCGHDLIARRPMWVPLDRVRIDYTTSAHLSSEIFPLDSNGIASGNNLAEAVLSGLLEVIERDALSGAVHARAGRREEPRTDTRGINRRADDFLEHCARAGVSAAVRDITSDLGVPAFEALLTDGDRCGRLPPIPPALGVGCHLDPGVALAKALTEGAQGRLARITGSRDNLRAADHTARAVEAGLDSADLTPHHTRMATRIEGAATIEGDITRLLNRLERAGFSEVVAVDLSPPDLAAAVVRVIVPHLRPPPGLPHQVPERHAAPVRG